MASPVPLVDRAAWRPDERQQELIDAASDVVAKRKSALHGHGLFAVSKILRGAIILPYVGPIVGPEDKALMSEDEKRYLYKAKCADSHCDGSRSIDGR